MVRLCDREMGNNGENGNTGRMGTQATRECCWCSYLGGLSEAYMGTD